MADKKNTSKPSEARIKQRNNADMKGLFSMYGDFGKPANGNKGTTKNGGKKK